MNKNSIVVIGISPGIPKIEIDNTIIELIIIDKVSDLLGLDSQKCFRSLTDNTVKYPERVS